MNLIITPLSKQHDRKSFDCGEPSLNLYLRRYAGQDIRRRVNRVFVASSCDAPQQIIGYYSLSAGSFDANTLPEAQKNKLPRYPVPVAVLGRLAIDKYFQGKGFGSILLADALKRTAQASQMMAVYAVVVDALNDQVCEFYQQFGFIQLPEQPRKLFLPITTINILVE